MKMTDLTAAERGAHLQYRQLLRDENRESLNQKARERYRKQKKGE